MAPSDDLTLGMNGKIHLDSPSTEHGTRRVGEARGTTLDGFLFDNGFSHGICHEALAGWCITHNGIFICFPFSFPSLVWLPPPFSSGLIVAITPLGWPGLTQRECYLESCLIPSHDTILGPVHGSHLRGISQVNVLGYHMTAPSLAPPKLHHGSIRARRQKLGPEIILDER